MKALFVIFLTLSLISLIGCIGEKANLSERERLEKAYENITIDEAIGYYLNPQNSTEHLVLKNNEKFELREVLRPEENQISKTNLQTAEVYIIRGNWRINRYNVLILDNISIQSPTSSPPTDYTILSGVIKKLKNGGMKIVGLNYLFNPNQPNGIWIKY